MRKDKRNRQGMLLSSSPHVHLPPYTRDEEAQPGPWWGIAAGISTLLAYLHHPKWLWTWAGSLCMTLQQPGVAKLYYQIQLVLT